MGRRPTDDTAFWYIDTIEGNMCFHWIDNTTKNSGQRDSTEALPANVAKQLVRTEQGEMLQNDIA